VIREVESSRLDLGGLQILPGLVNAHDHLSFALFPRLGRGPYPDAEAWARDIYHPQASPVREHLRVPKRLRLLWGGLRNLIAGVTGVSHHDPYDPVFDLDFPVRVVRRYGWAHSFAFTPDVAAQFAATPPGAPFLIHLAEGTTEAASREVFRLREIGALAHRTVLIHAVGLTEQGWQIVRDAGAAVVWCPRSNLFTLGRSLPDPLSNGRRGVPVALGTDSPLTAEGDLLDEIRAAGGNRVLAAVTDQARRILRIPARPGDWIAAPAFGEPPELVVIGGRIHLIAPRLAPQLPRALRHRFFSLRVEGRPPLLVRWNVPELLGQTRGFLDGPIRLAGRDVSA
jgi:cytosine/adenosine deaminase-related metal-dependent hydrolase